MKRCALFYLLAFALFSCDPTIEDGSCGDTIIDPGEECDGQQFGEDQSCLDFGLYGGELLCSSHCTVDTSQCGTEGRCGDGIVQVSNDYEQCDGENLNGRTCLSLGYDGGTLLCGASCRYDTSGCAGESLCGNNTINPGEECDGENLGENSCESEGMHGGTLLCAMDCTFDYSLCSFCGDGTVDEAYGEECEVNQVQDCVVAGEGFGMPTCEECQYNFASCIGSVQYGSPEDGYDYTEFIVTGAAADSRDNLYVVGSSHGNWGGLGSCPNGCHYLTKVNHLGENDWTTRIINSHWSPLAVLVRPDDTIVVQGVHVQAYYLKSFNSADGTLLTERTDDLSTDWRSLANGPNGTIWRAGFQSGQNLCLEKFTLDGTETTRYSYPAAGTLTIAGMLSLDNGGVLVFGNTTGDLAGVAHTERPICTDSGTDPSRDCAAPFLMRVAAGGEIQWARILNGNAPSELMLKGGVQTPGGRFVLCGETNYGPINGQPGFGHSDVACLWYTLDGTLTQTVVYGTVEANESFGGVGLDVNGNVVLAVNTDTDMWGIPLLGWRDLFVATLDANGLVLSSVCSSTPSTDENRFLVPLTSGESIYAVGLTTNDASPVDTWDVLVQHFRIPGH